MINTNNWKEFKINELFELIPIKNKLSRKDLEDDGDIPVYSSTTINNGIEGYTKKEADFHVNNNEIYVIFGDHTKAMSISVNDFAVMDNVKVLKPIYNDIDVIQYICTIWKKKIPSLGYARHWSAAKSIKIKLPVNDKNDIDIKYIKEYMEKLYKNCDETISKLEGIRINKKMIDTSNWNKYRIGDIFEISRPSARSQLNYEDGEIPFVASGNYNNGVIKLVKPKENEILDKGNCLSISPVDGSTFYQEKDFLGRGGAGSSIILLRNINLNKYNGLFLSTIIRNTCKKYFYSNMANKDTIRDEYITLPTDSNGDIDWNYMENYIKSLPYGADL